MGAREVSPVGKFRAALGAETGLLAVEFTTSPAAMGRLAKGADEQGRDSEGGEKEKLFTVDAQG